MKRSEINSLIRDSLAFFEERQFFLPPWARWSPADFEANGPACEEIYRNRLGWDLTDFGSGAFREEGLLLFTLRNGNPSRDRKTYSEKIMVVDEGQLTPTHFHARKMEDIINRGGGNLLMELWKCTDTSHLSDEGFQVSVDGVIRECGPGERICLRPGESISLWQGLYHCFYGEPGAGRVLVGEVSMVNDDYGDNHFLDGVGRFPEIEEDETPLHWLVNDYPE
jgi:D-lyxose ketol-isomerase